jgi:hypothetical protein
MVYYKGRNHHVHRVNWIIHNGPIPAEKLVCHKCDNPWCYRLDHLFAGTAKDNTTDMIIKGRARYCRGEFGNALLNDDKVREIYRLLAERKLRQGQIADRFGVSLSVISNINCGRIWRHLMPEGWVPLEQFIPFGERHGMAKLTEDQARQIRKLAWSGQFTSQEIADMFCISKPSVQDIKHRRTWKHLWKEEKLTVSPDGPAVGFLRRI